LNKENGNENTTANNCSVIISEVKLFKYKIVFVRVSNTKK